MIHTGTRVAHQQLSTFSADAAKILMDVTLEVEKRGKRKDKRWNVNVNMHILDTYTCQDKQLCPLTRYRSIHKPPPAPCSWVPWADFMGKLGRRLGQNELYGRELSICYILVEPSPQIRKLEDTETHSSKCSKTKDTNNSHYLSFLEKI